VWVAVGGRGTLIGPIIGAVFVNALKSWATRAYPDLWLIILGAMFIVVVLFLPGGIVSIPRRVMARWRRPPPPASPRPTPAVEAQAGPAKTSTASSAP
jgi:urea transport system permease protein